MLKFMQILYLQLIIIKYSRYYDKSSTRADPYCISYIINSYLNKFFIFHQKKMIQPKQALKTETNKQRLKKLITFLQYHAVNIQQIWTDDPHLSINEFANIMEEKYNYGLNTDELLGLKSIADQGVNLYVENFHHLGIWEGQLYEKQYKKRKVVKKDKKRPQTANSIIHRQKYSVVGSKASQSGVTINMCQSKTFLTKNSRYKMNQEQLEKKIIENALDKKWDYLIKVGEMNCWIKDSQIKQPVTSQDIKPKVQPIQKSKIYKIETTHQDIKIIEYNENGESQILPLKVFDQKYLSLRKKFVGQEKVKNNMKGTMLLVLDKKDKVSKAKLNQKISQRDQQLNYLLLEIIRIKNIFQQQDQVLSECGVNM